MPVFQAQGMNDIVVNKTDKAPAPIKLNSGEGDR